MTIKGKEKFLDNIFVDFKYENLKDDNNNNINNIDNENEGEKLNEVKLSDDEGINMFDSDVSNFNKKIWMR